MSTPLYSAGKVSSSNTLYYGKKKKKDEFELKKERNLNQRRMQNYDNILELSLNNISKEDVKEKKGVMKMLSGL